MGAKKNVVFGVILGGFLIAWLFSCFATGCYRKSDSSLKKTFLNNESSFKNITRVKHDLYSAVDTGVSFHISYTGKRYSQDIQVRGTDFYQTTKFLSTRDATLVEDFMYENNINDIFFFVNREEYVFRGFDRLIIGDSLYHDVDGILIEKNVYFHSWTPKKDD